MRVSLILLPVIFLTGFLVARDSEVSYPAKGTPLRQTICDEMRKYLRYTDQVDKSFGHFLFKVEQMAVLGDYCSFEGFPVNTDGSSSDSLPDVVYSTFLKKNASGSWEVIADLSRTDVPSDEEMREIRRTFPQGIPTAIIPEYWRPKLRG